MPGTPGQFGVTISDNVPPLYGLSTADYAGAGAAWDTLLGSTATAGKIFLNASTYPTAVSGFSSAAKMQAMIARGYRIYLCYQPGAKTDGGGAPNWGTDTYSGSNPAFVNQTTAQRTALVSSVTSLAAACAAAGTGATVAGVILYQEINNSNHNLAAGSGGNDGGYVGAVNFYGNAATGVKSIAPAAGFLGGNAPRLVFCSGSGTWSTIGSYFNPGAAQTTAYDAGMADYYGSAYSAGHHLDDATNGPDTICRALGIPLAIGEMGSASGTVMPSNSVVVTYIQHVQSIMVARLTGSLNNAETMWFDGQAATPVTRTLASGAGTVVGSSSSTTLKTTTAWPAGAPGTNYLVQAGTEIMQVTGGSGTTTLTVTRGMQGTTALATLTAGTPVSTLANGNNIITLAGDYRIPYLRAMITAITAAGSGGAFTERQDSISLNAAGGSYGMWFNEVGGTASVAGSLVLARFVTDDGAQTITAPAGFTKVSPATDAETGAGTSGVARAQIWAYPGNPGGLGGSQPVTATSASPCVFTVTGTAPANGTPVILGGTRPTGFSGNTVYYVVFSSGSTFELAATVSGTPINSTSAVTTGGVLAFPVVFTYSNTGATVRGHLTEYTTPAGFTQVADQASASTAHGVGNTMAVTCTGANTVAGGLGASIYGIAQTGGTTGQSISVPSPWTADGPSNNQTLSYNTFTQTGLAAGTTAGTGTYTPGTWTQTGWAAAMVTFYAASATGTPLNITTLTLPGGTSGVAYSQTVATTGGTGTVTLSLNPGSQPLPAGLTLTGAGVLAGTTTVPGAYAFTVLAADSTGATDTQDLTLAISGTPTITTGTPLPAGVAGTAYSQSLATTGGTAPYTYVVTTGLLNAGLALSSGGVFSGTPTVEGVAVFNVTVTDNVAATGVKTFTLTIAPAPPGPPTPDGGTPAVPMPGFPQLIVEAGFTTANPVAPPGTLILDDPVNGLLDTGTLGDRTAWTDITSYVRTGTTSRQSSRVQGPLRVYQPGTGSVTLDNTSGNFDPDNLSGAFVTGGVSSVRPMVPLRVRAVYGNVEYKVWSGFADNWAETPVTYDAGWSEVTVSGSDGFKILAGITLPPVAPLGAGELSGTRVNRILSNASWFTDHRRIDPGDSPVQATTYGDTALNLLQLTADTEIGELYIDGAGNVVFRHRKAAISDARSVTPQAAFGDKPGLTVLSGQNTGFEGGAGTWTNAGNCTTTATAAAARTGTGALQMSSTAAGDMLAVHCLAANILTQGLPVTPGQPVAAAVWALTASAARAVQAGAQFYDAGGAALSVLRGPAVTDSTTGWAQATATVTAPPGAAFCRLSILVQATAGAAEIHYLDDAQLYYPELPYAAPGRANDDTTLASDVQITRVGGTLQEVADPGAVSKYLFPRSYARSDIILQTDAEALGYAQWVLYVSLTGEERFDTITIDPIADPVNLFPQVLGREIGDLITVIRRPQNSAAVISKPCFIRGITHAVDVTAGTWQTTWDLQDASKYSGFLILDDPVAGKLSSGNKLGY